jgi:MscS family membrane protein
VLFGAAVFATLVLTRLVDWAFRVQLRRLVEASETELDDAVVDALERPIQLIVLSAGVLFSSHFLHVPDGLRDFVDNVITVLITVFFTWGVSRSIDAFRLVVVDPWVEATETKLDDQIVPILDNTLKAVLWSMAVLTAFTMLGYDVLSLLTGLGIGGVAVAMAAQATLSNVFGSVSIFADQPFQMDDLVTLGEHTGVVTEVGLRTVRMRTLRGYRVTVPNHAAVADAVVCRSPDGSWRYDGELGLVYQTTADELKHAMVTLTDILESHPSVSEHQVRFMSFAASSLQLRFAFYLESPSIQDYLDTIHDVNMAIKERFDAEGLRFAYPTITVHGPE